MGTTSSSRRQIRRSLLNLNEVLKQLRDALKALAEDQQLAAKTGGNTVNRALDDLMRCAHKLNEQYRKVDKDVDAIDSSELHGKDKSLYTSIEKKVRECAKLLRRIGGQGPAQDSELSRIGEDLEKMNAELHKTLATMRQPDHPVLTNPVAHQIDPIALIIPLLFVLDMCRFVPKWLKVRKKTQVTTE